MNEKYLRIQSAIQQMKTQMKVLERLGEELPKNPKLYADRAQAPLEDLERMRKELDDLFDEFKPPSLRRANVG